MLGINKGKFQWQWAVFGKHPLAADYFHAGEGNLVQEALAAWMDQGFAALPKAPESRQAICFWRLWMQGGKRGHLLCGLLKASSDRIGRPYPLLIIGGGSLNGWEKYWVYLPALLENLWQQIEYVASKRVERLEDLADAIQKTHPPGVERLKTIDMQKIEAQHAASGNAAEIPAGDIKTLVNQINARRMVMVPLDNLSNGHSESLPVLWSLRLKTHGMDLPKAVFIGGAPGRQYFVAFPRSLNAMDFVNLWTV